MCGRGVELDSFGQVELGDYGDVRAMEDGGIIERFVFAFGDREENEAQVFAQIIGRGADEIADIFDEEKIERADLPIAQSILERIASSVSHERSNARGFGSRTSRTGAGRRACYRARVRCVFYMKFRGPAVAGQEQAAKRKAQASTLRHRRFGIGT